MFRTPFFRGGESTMLLTPPLHHFCERELTFELAHSSKETLFCVRQGTCHMVVSTVKHDKSISVKSNCTSVCVLQGAENKQILLLSVEIHQSVSRAQN